MGGERIDAPRCEGARLAVAGWPAPAHTVLVMDINRLLPADWPRIDEPTADFTYARLMSSKEDEPTGMSSDELDGVVTQTRDWAKRGDVFAYFIAGAKVRNPAAAMALIEKLGA